MNATKLSSKRKATTDVNDNFDPLDPLTVPAPPPALRNASSRRMTIAGGTLPGLPWAVPAPAVPTGEASHASAPAPSHSSSGYSSQARRLAEESHADSVFNNYITTLGLKFRTRLAAARIERDVDEQLSTILQETVKMKVEVAEGKISRDTSVVLSSGSLMAKYLAKLDENLMKQCSPLETLTMCVENHMNSLKCKEVKPMVKAEDFDKIDESLNELGETMCIPHETMENSVSSAECLCGIGNSINAATEENNCLDELKGSYYRILATNFSSTMKL